MTDSGQRRECTHTRVHHQHNTRAAYVADRCRCVPCTLANRAAGQQRRRAMTRGTWRPYRSPAVAVRRVHLLLAAGMTVTDIAAAASVARSTVSALMQDPPRRIRVSTHAALMSVKPPPRRSTTSRAAKRRLTTGRRPSERAVAG